MTGIGLAADVMKPITLLVSKARSGSGSRAGSGGDMRIGADAANAHRTRAPLSA